MSGQDTPSNTEKAYRYPIPNGIGDINYLQTLLASIADQDLTTGSSPTFAAIKLTTGAGLGKVLTSDADGDATWGVVAFANPMTGAGELIYGGASGVATALAAGATTTILVGGGAAAPVWTTATGTGAPMRGTSPTITTSLIMSNGATIGQAAGPLVAFDDTGNALNITGAGSVSISAAQSLLSMTSATGTNRVGLYVNNTSGSAYAALEDSAGGGWITGTSAYAAIYGHSGNYPVQFVSYNAVRMTILGSGYVGIGTTAPNGPFEVKVATNANLNVKTAVALSGAVLLSAENDAGNANTPLEIRSSVTDFSAGNVGIGTASPSTHLHVLGSGAFQNNADFPSDGKGIEIVPETSAGVDAIQAYNRGTSAWRSLGLWAGVLTFNISGSERFRIDANSLYTSSWYSYSGAGVQFIRYNDYLTLNTSSERWKTKIERNWKSPLLDDYLKINPIRYEAKEDGKSPPPKEKNRHVLGFSAEELDASGVPGLVVYDDDSLPLGIWNTGFLVYHHLVLQDLNAKYLDMEKRLSDLEKNHRRDEK